MIINPHDKGNVIFYIFKNTNKNCIIYIDKNLKTTLIILLTEHSSQICTENITTMFSSELMSYSSNIDKQYIKNREVVIGC